MRIRSLLKQDMENDEFRVRFFELLNAKPLDRQRAVIVFNKRDSHVVTFIGVDTNDLPIATVSLLLEWKFIYGGILNGHIEDVCVLEEYRHQGLGAQIMKHVMDHAKQFCKRVVLECKPELEEFYKIHNFKTHSIAMRQQNTKL